MLLRERELTLEKTIDICKAAEKATTHGKVYRTEPDTVHKVTEQKNKGLQSTHRPLREMRQDTHLTGKRSSVNSAVLAM